jgi:hypothetical protein
MERTAWFAIQEAAGNIHLTIKTAFKFFLTIDMIFKDEFPTRNFLDDLDKPNGVDILGKYAAAPAQAAWIICS